MSHGTGPTILRRLHHLLEEERARGASDAQLLERWAGGRDEAAFAELVRRHGPLVQGVCRRVLVDANDADDVFQATFLVLASRPGAVARPASLRSFLHGVAARLALRLRSAATRRRNVERSLPCPPPRDPLDEVTWREVCTALDEELLQLPEKHRLPLLLCYLEGQTQDEAAQALGWRRGTLKRRLERGRELLHARLTARGLTLSAALTAPLLVPGAVSSAPAVPLVGATARVTHLVDGMLKAMMLSRLKVTAAVILSFSLLAGAGVMGRRALAAKPPSPAAVGGPARARPAPAPAAAVPNAAPGPGAPNPPPAPAKPAGRLDRHGDPLPVGALGRVGTTRLRQGARIYEVSLTPDGKVLATAGLDRAVRLWDTATGKPLHRLEHPGVVFFARFAPDGKTIASGGVDHEVRLWDVASGRLLRTLEGHTSAVRTAAFTPDGKTLASTGHDATVRLWDPVTGGSLGVCPVAKQLFALTFIGDGKLMAGGGQDGIVRVWEARSGKAVCQCAGTLRWVRCVASTRDGKWLAAGGDDGIVRLFETATGKEVRQFPKLETYQGAIHSVAFTADGKTLAAAGESNTVVGLFDVASGKVLRRFPTGRGDGVSVALSADGRVLAAGGARNLARLWDTATGTERLAAFGPRGDVSSLVFSPDGNLLATGGWNDTPRLWDPVSSRLLRRCAGAPQGLRALVFTPDGRTLLASCLDNKVHPWVAATGAAGGVLPGLPEAYLFHVCPGADGKPAIIVGFHGKQLHVRLAGKEVRVLEGHTNVIRNIGVSADGRTVASGGFDHNLCLWDTRTGKLLSRVGIGTIPEVLAFSPDGRTLATADLNGAVVQLWDVPGGKLLHSCVWNTKGGVRALAFAPDGRTLASGGIDMSVRLWEVATGLEVCMFKGHTGWVSSLAFAPDGRTLASGSIDTTALLWDVTGQRQGGAPPAALTPRRLESLWADLGASDAARAHRARWELAFAPKQVVPFLAKALGPGSRVTEKQLARLIAELDDDDFAVREKATAALQTLGREAEEALRVARKETSSAEVRRRIDDILGKLKGAEVSTRLRARRALAVLESVGSPEARKVLASVADGKGEADFVREAKASLARLARRAVR